MSELCPDCGVKIGLSRSLCSKSMMGAEDGDHWRCAKRTIARLRARLALAEAVVEAADRLRQSDADGSWLHRWDLYYDPARAALAALDREAPVGGGAEEAGKPESPAGR